jgi:hypothetical protein
VRIERTVRASPTKLGEALVMCLVLQTPSSPNAFIPTPFLAGMMVRPVGETGRWRLRFMEDGRCRSRHRPVPVALPADKARGAPFFPPGAWCPGGGGPGADGSGHNPPDHPSLASLARFEGAQRRHPGQDRGMGRLHRIGGMGDRACRAYARQASVQGITGHFHGVPIPYIAALHP